MRQAMGRDQLSVMPCPASARGSLNKRGQLSHRSNAATRAARVRSSAYAVLTGPGDPPPVSLSCVECSNDDDLPFSGAPGTRSGRQRAHPGMWGFEQGGEFRSVFLDRATSTIGATEPHLELLPGQ